MKRGALCGGVCGLAAALALTACSSNSAGSGSPATSGTAASPGASTGGSTAHGTPISLVFLTGYSTEGGSSGDGWAGIQAMFAGVARTLPTVTRASVMHAFSHLSNYSTGFSRRCRSASRELLSAERRRGSSTRRWGSRSIRTARSPPIRAARSPTRSPFPDRHGRRQMQRSHSSDR
jgi:hypothetical protein